MCVHFDRSFWFNSLPVLESDPCTHSSRWPLELQPSPLSSKNRRKKEEARICLSYFLTFPGSCHIRLYLYLISQNSIIGPQQTQETIEKVVFTLGDLIAS